MLSNPVIISNIELCYRIIDLGMSNTVYADKHKKLGLCINCVKPVVKGSKIFVIFIEKKIERVEEVRIKD